jgi:uncharacterized damage-inducible protein DinB
MIGISYAQTMARYNRWQNDNLYAAADRLSDDERKRERGAFFGSIQKTLSHLMWADQIWLSRFEAGARPNGRIPESVSLYPDWQPLKRERAALDAEIIRWAEGLNPDWLGGHLTFFSFSAGQDISGPRWMFVSHFFNHQTHHRGQIHCMLTQAGATPHDTDLSMMPGFEKQEEN